MFLDSRCVRKARKTQIFHQILLNLRSCRLTMPTSGECGIVPSSTYNLRSRPLPKTTSRPTSRNSNNKENIGTRKAAPSTKLTKKTNQSKIPLPNSKIPVPRTTRTTRSTTAKTTTASSTPTRRKVPDFEKLHKSWNKKFQQGKAVAKKPCTQTAAFDLTRPGTHFRRAYYDGTKKDVKTRRQTGFAFATDDEFEVDNGALNDILNGKGLEEDEKQQSTVSSRATLAGTGISSDFAPRVGGRRQTLGQLPTTGAGRVNSTANISSVSEIDKRMDHHGKKSLVQEQREAGITFEASADALASILNNTGLESSDRHHNIIGGRQTIAGMSAKQRQSGRFNVTTGRNSIYYQKPKNHDVNKVYSEFAKRTLSRFTMDGNQASFKTAFIDSLLPDNRGSLYIKPGLSTSEKPTGISHTTSSAAPSSSVAKNLRAITPARVPVADKTKSTGAIGRTPGTASRIPNPHFNEALNRQEQSCSPALTPARRIPTTPGGQTQKNVRWADVLSSPTDGDRADHMHTKDVVAVLNFGDDGDDAISPETKTRLHQVEKLEAETVANRQRLNEMEEIEKQLELEIARLHQAGDVEELETSEQPISHPSSSTSHTVMHQHAVESHTSAMLDHVPTKQPADYVDPVRLPKKDTTEAVNIHTTAPAVAVHAYGSVANMELHQQTSMEGHNLQERFHTEQSHMQATDFERKVGHQQEEGSVPIEMNLVNASSARSIDMITKESVSAHVPFVSQDVQGVHDKLSRDHHGITSNGVDSGIHDRRLQSPWGLDGRTENGQELMVSDSTEAFRGVFPAFLHNSGQLSKHPEAQTFPNTIPDQRTFHGHARLQASTAFKIDEQDFVNSRSIDSGHYINAHIGHSKEGVYTENSVPFSSPHDSIMTMDTNDPCGRGIESQSVLGASAASTKPHIQHDTQQSFSVPSMTTIPPVQNPRLTIHTPQPVRSARGRTSFLKPTPDLRSMSTPLHHSSVTAAPIQTPLSMRNSSIPQTMGTEHQQWPSPVVPTNTPSFQSYGQNASNLPVPTTFHTAKLQEQGLTSSTRSTLTNSVGHASVAGSSYPSSHPVNVPVKSHLNRPATSLATAFQYRRPHTASTSERTHTIPSQGQTSGVARSLSLSDSLMGVRSRDQVLPVNQQVENEREASSQLFHQVLLDEECALYACRLKGRYTPQSLEPRPINPIAKVLLYGDDMHFVPVRDLEFLVSSPTGSAFSNYYTKT